MAEGVAGQAKRQKVLVSEGKLSALVAGRLHLKK